MYTANLLAAHRASRETTMAERTELTERLLHVVRSKQECLLEDLFEDCASYTWDEIVGEVNRLSRTGHIHVQRTMDYDFGVSLPRAG